MFSTFFQVGNLRMVCSLSAVLTVQIRSQIFMKGIASPQLGPETSHQNWLRGFFCRTNESEFPKRSLEGLLCWRVCTTATSL